LFGREGTFNAGIVSFSHLNAFIGFDGGMVVCRDRRPTHRFPLSPAPAWQFNVVLELEFRAGYLVGRWDHSTAVADLVERHEHSLNKLIMFRELRNLMAVPELAAPVTADSRLVESYREERKKK
jgi:hypothetical protein